MKSLEEPVSVSDVPNLKGKHSYDCMSESYAQLPRLSHAQLAQYNGIIKPQIYVAIRGLVFEVTKNKERYGEGKAYFCLVGRDVSRLLGLNSMKDPQGTGLENTTWYTADFDERQNSLVDKWLDFFFKRYLVVAITDSKFEGDADSVRSGWLGYLYQSIMGQN